MLNAGHLLNGLNGVYLHYGIATLFIIIRSKGLNVSSTTDILFVYCRFVSFSGPYPFAKTQ